MGEGKRQCKIFTIICVLFLAHLAVNAQEEENSTDWDNQLFVGNKVSGGEDQWKYSGELQFRVKDNFSQLDNWFVEGVFQYLPSKYWELVPDFRFSVHPEGVEYRPGFGVLFKVLSPKWQFVNQVKYQADIYGYGGRGVGHGIRHIMFLNYVYSEKLVPTLAAGYFFSSNDRFTGLEFVRFGGGVTLIMDPVHRLNISYFFGVANDGKNLFWSGIPLIQLTIVLRDDYKYVPAHYINF